LNGESLIWKLWRKEGERHKMKIPITKPVFDNCERENILKPLESGWLVQGPYVAEFERLFAEFTGTRWAKGASNCTTALHLGLDALGIKTGDKVVVPSFTYIASANAVEYTGAKVVFCDIDLATFNIDVNKLKEILEEDKERRIKAIMPVDLFGLCADLPEIMRLAKKHNLKVIEDSACGLGAWIGDKHSGTFGEVGCFSFHPRKSITTGEGGMLITDDEEIANKVSSLRDHGAGKSDLARHKEKGGSLLPDFNLRGYNYRMSDLQGALGVSQMKKANYILKKRREVAARYDEALKEFDGLITPYVPDDYTHGYQSYVCLFTNGEDITNLDMEKVDRINVLRNRFMERLEEKEIATRQGTHAVHTLGYYKRRYNLNDEDYIISYAADRLSVALPLYAEMTDSEFGYVVDGIKRGVGE
jgi:dTDP-4-amino-4,6-dideoxygalactose transaminase